MTAMPLRCRELVEQQLGDEIVIYDERTQHAHALDGLNAAAWPYCDGSTSVAAVAERLGVDVESVELAVEQLTAAGLLEHIGVTRRSALRQGAFVAGGVLVASSVTSVLVPSAAHAASAGGGPGGGPNVPTVTVTTGQPTHDTFFPAQPTCGALVVATGFPANTPVALSLSAGIEDEQDSGPNQAAGMTDGSGSVTFNLGDVYNDGPSSGTVTVFTTSGPPVQATSASFPVQPDGTC